MIFGADLDDFSPGEYIQVIECRVCLHGSATTFQFYDQLSQRLLHVCRSLGELADLIGDSSRLYQPNEWNNLQESIKSKYVIARDKAMFDAILNGATVEEALQISKEQDGDDDDNIELF